LNAVAVLVRDTEVVAASIRNPSPPTDTGTALQGGGSEASSEDNPEDVGLDDLTPDECKEIGNAIDRGFAAIANPDLKDKYFFPQDAYSTYGVKIATAGESHWEEIIKAKDVLRLP
jgi:hypothetical protein